MDVDQHLVITEAVPATKENPILTAYSFSALVLN